MAELALNEAYLQELKEDLIKGKNLNPVDAVKHFKNNPQRIIYTIVKMCVSSDGQKVFTSKAILEEYKKGLEVPKEGIWNPIAWFSQVLRQISDNRETRISEYAEDVFRRWYDIIDKRWSKGYIYAIANKKTFTEIKKIFLEVEQL